MIAVFAFIYCCMILLLFLLITYSVCFIDFICGLVLFVFTCRLCFCLLPLLVDFALIYCLFSLLLIIVFACCLSLLPLVFAFSYE